MDGNKDKNSNALAMMEYNGNAEEIKDRFNELYERIKNHIEENELENILYIYLEENTILIRMSDSAFFDSGKDEIKEDSEIILLEMSEIIQDYVDLIQEIIIEGHTDTVRFAQQNLRII